MDENQACENTDVEILRQHRAGFSEDTLHVTKDGALGINCGGYVIVKPIREWFRLATLEANFVFVMDENGHITCMAPPR